MCKNVGKPTIFDYFHTFDYPQRTYNPWCHLTPSWDFLRTELDSFGTVLGPSSCGFASILDPLGSILNHEMCAKTLENCWFLVILHTYACLPGSCSLWCHLGPSWHVLGTENDPLGGVLGPSWRGFEAILDLLATTFGTRNICENHRKRRVFVHFRTFGCLQRSRKDSAIVGPSTILRPQEFATVRVFFLRFWPDSEGYKLNFYPPPPRFPGKK